MTATAARGEALATADLLSGSVGEPGDVSDEPDEDEKGELEHPTQPSKNETNREEQGKDAGGPRAVRGWDMTDS